MLPFLRPRPTFRHRAGKRDFQGPGLLFRDLFVSLEVRGQEPDKTKKTAMRRKNIKSMLCMVVFAIVSLHSFLLHGHRDACPERHLHAFAHCDQLDIFIPADTGSEEQTDLFCIAPELPFRVVPSDHLFPSGRLPDCSDPFIAADCPDIGGTGLRAPPTV